MKLEEIATACEECAKRVGHFTTFDIEIGCHSHQNSKPYTEISVYIGGTTSYTAKFPNIDEAVRYIKLQGQPITVDIT